MEVGKRKTLTKELKDFSAKDAEFRRGVRRVPLRDDSGRKKRRAWPAIGAMSLAAIAAV
jgi:hypothetical protein